MGVGPGVYWVVSEIGEDEGGDVFILISKCSFLGVVCSLRGGVVMDVVGHSLLVRDDGAARSVSLG